MSKLNTALLAGGMFTALLCAGVALAAFRCQQCSGRDGGREVAGTLLGGNDARGPGAPRRSRRIPDSNLWATIPIAGQMAGYDQPTWRYADLNNPNLTQFAKGRAEEGPTICIMRGFALYARTSRCWQPGVVVLNLSSGAHLFHSNAKGSGHHLAARTRLYVTFYLNVPHTQNPKPSWNGESVGHYEGRHAGSSTTIGQTHEELCRRFPHAP